VFKGLVLYCIGYIMPLAGVEDSDIRCERLAVGNMFGVAVLGFSISASHVFTDSSRVCANPLVPW
jgi:hypothetical protein